VSTLNIERFDDYFEALHGRPPYPWQRELARRAIAGSWPRVIDLPTGSGKTACIDIAVFALACQAEWTADQQSAPRRIFFCVNRRVVVDEAYDRARRIAKAIGRAEQAGPGTPDILSDVAEALRRVAGTTSDHLGPPLDVLELRGGIYRDNRWARSLTQPTVICTTVDQLGSRLLFRGYGVSSNAAPIQAALIAYDSLILLDEAHISRPFLETLDYARRYLDSEKWAQDVLNVRPAAVVPMTATPPTDVRDDELLRLAAEDRAVPQLHQRLGARKPARLVEAKNVGPEAVKLARDATQGDSAAIGIIVNRVDTARQIYADLKAAQQPDAKRNLKIGADVCVGLVIGSMRPLDRDDQAKSLRELVGPERPPISEQTSIVVSTQCLEVGADYDFDVLITECAALDALRQRFGRLNRRGRDINARAHILIDKKQAKAESKLTDDKPDDPIYGNALARTWNWLCEHATQRDDGDSNAATIDFGIDAFQTLLAEHGDNGRPPAELLSPSAHQLAPVMLPAYLDLWCQTSPRPEPDPDVALFIHGPQRTIPDVQVCWRADIDDNDERAPDELCDIVALLPPTSAECMTVPIHRLRQWLIGATGVSNGDLLGEPEPEDTQQRRYGDQPAADVPRAVLWRGADRSIVLRSPDDLRPGDTLVLAVSAGGWNELGHIPGVERTANVPIDVAERAFSMARNRAVLRLHPAQRSRLPSTTAIAELLQRATDAENLPTKNEWRELLTAAADSLQEDAPLRDTLAKLADPPSGLVIEYYPQHRGVVLVSKKRMPRNDLWGAPALDDGEDQPSRTLDDEGISLSTHTRHVLSELDNALGRLPLGALHSALQLAAAFHDTGKADERFQALLRRADRTDAWLYAGAMPTVLAKSAAVPLSPHERDAARRRAGLPRGFRHEMLAVQLAEQWTGIAELAEHRDLALHLIAAHHGHARPFAPVVLDPEPPDVQLTAPARLGGTDTSDDNQRLAITADQRQQCPPHRLDSGIAERFWRLTRRFGWWGLAYIEAVLRLADQQASAGEEAGKYDKADQTEPAEVNA
jgi:CRISPR-associated endonuclease/helicase Cas3